MTGPSTYAPSLWSVKRPLRPNLSARSRSWRASSNKASRCAAARTVAACDPVVRIPMAGGVDSLNVATAAAIAFYQVTAGDSVINRKLIGNPAHGGEHVYEMY